MKWVRSAICTCLLLACWCDGQASAATASYTVTFEATWSQATHPNAYPPGAHFSSLIGGVHNDQVSFWSPGGLASAGIEQMAEVGGTAALRAEVQAAINAGTGSAVIQDSGILSPGSTSVSFDVSDAFPLVTLVTMVAPSPDWFVGVHNFDLRAGTDWTHYTIVDLFPHDAGTEEGVNFSLSNLPTDPPQPIVLLGFPFAPDDPRMGTLTFARYFAGRLLGDYNDNGVVDAADYIVWRESEGRSGMNLPADGNVDGKIDADDYGIWLEHFGRSVVSSARVPGLAAVPEATAGVLLLSAASVLVGHRRQRTPAGGHYRRSH